MGATTSIINLYIKEYGVLNKKWGQLPELNRNYRKLGKIIATITLEDTF